MSVGRGGEEAQPAGHAQAAVAQAEALSAAEEPRQPVASQGYPEAGVRPVLPPSRFQREAHHSRRGHVDEGHRAWAQTVCQLAKDDPVSQGLAQVLSQ